MKAHACLCAKLLKSCPTLCNPMDCIPPGSSVQGDSSGKSTGVCCHALLQGIFPTKGSDQHLFCLLHWQVGSLPPASPWKPMKPVACCKYTNSGILTTLVVSTVKVIRYGSMQESVSISSTCIGSYLSHYWISKNCMYDKRISATSKGEYLTKWLFLCNTACYFVLHSSKCFMALSQPNTYL